MAVLILAEIFGFFLKDFLKNLLISNIYFI